MPKRRRLGDLYVTGKPVKINDDSGDPPIEVWVQKLSPIEQENALRRASVERAKYLAVVSDRESDLWQSIWADLHEFAPGKEQLLPIALRDELAKAHLRIEAEVSGEEEWTKENYLQAIFDAWEGTTPLPADFEFAVPQDDTGAPTVFSEEGEAEPLKISYLRGPEDDRYGAALAVYNEVQRWSAEVEKRYKGEVEALYRDWDDTPIEALRDKAVEKMLEQNASTAMLEEFETQEVFYSVRLAEQHSKRYFESRDEVQSLQPEVRRRLVTEFRTLLVDPAEGKGLPGTPGSSPQSDSSEPEATDPSSGPEE